MQSVLAFNIALAFSSAVFLIIFLLPSLWSKKGSRQMRYLWGAEALHALASVLFAAGWLNKLGEQIEVGYPLTWTARILDGISLLFLLLSIFLKEKSIIPQKHPALPFRVDLAAAVLLPLAAGVSAELVFPGVKLIGFSSAVSLCLVHKALEREQEAALRQREEMLDQRSARVLVEQIHPHFVANALMSIQQLCYTDPEAAAQRIEDFAGYLRANIDALTTDELIPFETELEHIQQYVALEQADPARIFTIDFHLNAGDFLLPALTVQPIVENAIRHGALCRKDQMGKVTLTTERVGKFIRVTVEDNGIGKPADTPRQDQHHGVGIQNVRFRLEKQCGGALTLTQGDQGMKAVITLPNMEEEDVHNLRG